MSKFLTILAITAAVSISKVSAKSTDCIGSCRDTYIPFLPHKICSKFCMCSQGRPIEASCPEGLHFSSKNFVCMNPAEAQCQEEDYSSRGCIGECFCEDPNKVCLLAHENCNKFCLCRCAKNTEVHNCPEGLHFNVEQARCDLPYYANCPNSDYDY